MQRKVLRLASAFCFNFSKVICVVLHARNGNFVYNLLIWLAAVTCDQQCAAVSDT